MSKEQINYDDHLLDPKNDVLVPLSTYTALVNIVAGLENQEIKKFYTIKTAYFNRVTHERLSDKSRAKMKQNKLDKEYYQNIDFSKTVDTATTQVTEIGLAAIQLNGEFRGIFRHNVDKGNSILRSQIPAPTPLVETEDKEVAGPTLVKDDSKE